MTSMRAVNDPDAISAVRMPEGTADNRTRQAKWSSAVKTILSAILMVAGSAVASFAGTADQVRATYLRFAEAQNARDAQRIGAFFVDGPDFLWVSDGKSFWGREAVLARMGSFQKAAVWRVEPELDAASVIELAPEAALLHMPLTLVIGSVEAPDRLRFLVTILFVRETGAWRIAALLTTNEKP
jgi:uncharacterized protein (TIGR02246 family)